MILSKILIDIGNQIETIIDSIKKEASDKPHYRRMERIFKPKEVAELCGITAAHLNKLVNNNHNLPQGVVSTTSRRLGWHLDELIELLKYFEKQAFDPKLKNKISSVIAVFSHKGGVGKTTTALNAAQNYAIKGFKVLLIDLDPQSSLTEQFSIKLKPNAKTYEDGSPYELAEYLCAVKLGDQYLNIDPDVHSDASSNILLPHPSNLIHHSHWHGIDIIPSTDLLPQIDYSMPSVSVKLRGNRDLNYKFYDRLNIVLNDIKDDYDIVLIDLPPAVAYTTTNALFACDGIVVPIRPQMMSVNSTRKFLKRFGEQIQSIIEMGEKEKEISFIRFVLTETRRKRDEKKSFFIASSLRHALSLFNAASTVDIPYSSAVDNTESNYKNLYESMPADISGDQRTVVKAREVYTDLSNEILDLINETIWENQDANE